MNKAFNEEKEKEKEKRNQFSKVRHETDRNSREEQRVMVMSWAVCGFFPLMATLMDRNHRGGTK